MKEHNDRSWFDSLVAYSPILALLLGWVTLAGKATKIDNPYIWVVGLTTIPALLAIIYSGIIVYRHTHQQRPDSQS